MPMYIFKQIKKYLSYVGKTLKKRKILFLGISYKENCGDFRNSKAIKLHNLLKRENKVDVFDNFVNKESLFNQHKIKLIKKKSFKNNYDLIVVCVPHKSIKKFSIKFLNQFVIIIVLYLISKEFFLERTSHGSYKKEMVARKNGPLLIAEIGANHEGNFNYAKKLLKICSKTNVDVVKFQIYEGSSIVNKILAPEKYNHFKKFELTKKQHLFLASMAKKLE